MTHRAGTSVHLIADLVAADGLDDVERVEHALREAAAAARLTILDVRLHHFGAGMGVTGVALLAESHISIHTWPEDGLAAVDLFVCGEEADPEAALRVICARFQASVRERRLIPRLRPAVAVNGVSGEVSPRD